MSSRKKQSSNLIIQFLCMLFFFLFIYMIVSIFTSRTMPCGCGTGCGGRNVSCPCYRNNGMRQSPYSNEYYKPQIGTDFTSYLNQVRENQLKFSREGFKEGAGNMSPRPTLTQKNIPKQLNSIRSRGGIASLMKK